MTDLKRLLKIDHVYVLGVSGGCDSMALLDIMHRAGYSIIVCHVNYHLRADSDLDQKTVEDYCKTSNIPCFVKEIDKHNYGQDNFQMQARKIRYEFYRKIALEHDIDEVVLAHHLDDVIENIVMQQQRGNTKGYLGIKEVSEVLGLKIIRPFLHIKKQVLRKYCHENGVFYRDDYTNFESHFTRDYVRNITLKSYDQKQIDDLLKKAKEHNEKYLKNYQRLDNYLDSYHQKGTINYQQIPSDLLEIFIYEILKEKVYPPLISDSLIKEIIKQINSDKPNIEMDLPVNIRFIKEYNNIRVSELKKYNGYCLKYKQLVYDKHEHFYLSDKGHLNEGIYLTKEDFPITIRTYLPGDIIVTAGGTKKVSRIYIDKKIPKSQRNIWPIVVNCQGEIILIPHLAKNIRYLYSKPNLYVVKL